MSGRDSLYEVSVSPPPRQRSRSGNMDYASTQHLNSSTPRAESSKRASGIGSLKNYFQQTKPLPYKAPIAKMRETPWRDEATAFRTPTSNLSSERKYGGVETSPPVLRSNITKPKGPLEYQAEVEAIEAARDRADPDFRDTQESISVSRRKRRETAAAPPQSSSVKQKRQRNFLYANCAEQTKAMRDKYVARIRDNWGSEMSEWMPERSMPSRLKKVRGKRATAQPLEDLRDWNGALLDELSYLSSLTKNRPREAQRALADAVAEKKPGRRGLELLPTDVQQAIRRLGSMKAGPPAPARNPTPSPDPVLEEAEISAEQLLNEATAGMDEDEIATQLPSPRSPTFGRDVIVKQESRPAAPVPPSDNDGWDYNAELEKCEELDLQFKEEEARLAMVRADRARFEQRKRMRELARQHGNHTRDAILITAEQGDE